MSEVNSSPAAVSQLGQPLLKEAVRVRHLLLFSGKDVPCGIKIRGQVPERLQALLQLSNACVRGG